MDVRYVLELKSDEGRREVTAIAESGAAFAGASDSTNTLTWRDLMRDVVSQIADMHWPKEIR